MTMTTTATPPKLDRAEINRRNAQKSTGPRTPEGKNRSRFNAVKHGMTARTLVLPGEDPDALQERLDSWIGNLQPQNEVEQFLVEQAVQSSWKLDRADRAEVARLSHIIETLPVAEANRQQEEAAALGRRLFSDRNGSGSIKLQSQILEALLPGRKSQTSRPLDVLDHAGAIVRRLESTGPGCQWMLDRWIELRTLLDQGQPWPSIEKSRAIRLLGKPPLNLTAEEWENHCERRRANPHPEIDGYLARKLDRQLVEGLRRTRRRRSRSCGASPSRRSRGWSRSSTDIAGAPRPMWPGKRTSCRSTPAPRASGCAATSSRAAERYSGASIP